MENLRTLSAVVRVGFVAAVCTLIAADCAMSQQNVPGAPAVKDPFAEARERRNREATLRSAEMGGAAKEVNTRELEAAAKQVRNDFKDIQVMRNNVVRHLKSEKALDYKFIASETEGIGKRANRLKTHLARDAVEGEKKVEGNQIELRDNQMEDALVTMCKRIDSFTENPIFKLTDVVDAAQSSKASRDLRDIILLSEGIVKLADRLGKKIGK